MLLATKIVRHNTILIGAIRPSSRLLYVEDDRPDGGKLSIEGICGKVRRSAAFASPPFMNQRAVKRTSSEALDVPDTAMLVARRTGSPAVGARYETSCVRCVPFSVRREERASGPPGRATDGPTALETWHSALRSLDIYDFFRLRRRTDRKLPVPLASSLHSSASTDDGVNEPKPMPNSGRVG